MFCRRAPVLQNSAGSKPASGSGESDVQFFAPASVVRRSGLLHSAIPSSPTSPLGDYLIRAPRLLPVAPRTPVFPTALIALAPSASRRKSVATPAAGGAIRGPADVASKRPWCPAPACWPGSQTTGTYAPVEEWSRRIPTTLPATEGKKP